MRIFLDPGHNCPPRDTGAVGILNEEKVAKAICFELQQVFLSWGHEVKVSNATDGSSVTNSLSDRCSDANSWNPDLFMSLHCNANENTTKPMGTEVFAASTKGSEYAKKIHDAIVSLGFKARGVKDGSHLFVIKHTQAVAVLVEFFFIDSSVDCDLYQNIGAKQMAIAIARSLVPIPKSSDEVAPKPTTDKNIMPENTANVRPHFLADASKYDKNLDHQVEAWDWLQSQIDDAVLTEFKTKFTPSGSSIGLATESTPKTFDPANVDWSDGNSKISKYFTVVEATKGEAARTPSAGSDVAKNILSMAAELDKLREAYGKPIGVTSWYRPAAINRAVGGASQSQHIHGRGVDIYPIDGDINDFQKWCDARWYGALGYGAHRGFIHLDNRNGKGFESGGEKGVRWNY